MQNKNTCQLTIFNVIGGGALGKDIFASLFQVRKSIMITLLFKSQKMRQKILALEMFFAWQELVDSFWQRHTGVKHLGKLYPCRSNLPFRPFSLEICSQKKEIIHRKYDEYRKPNFTRESIHPVNNTFSRLFMAKISLTTVNETWP